MFNKLFGTMEFRSALDKANIETMFKSYMSDLPDNFYLDQFSLAKKYDGTSYEDWVRIMKHSAFSTWKAEQIAIIATTATDKALASGDDTSTGALNMLKLRQDVLNSEKKIEKPTVIVLPESLYFKEDKP